MGKAFGLVMMLIAMYLGMQIYSEGMESVWNSVVAPIQGSSDSGSPRAAHLSPAAMLADEPAAPSRPRKLTDRVRDSVTSDLQAGAQRRYDALD